MIACDRNVDDRNVDDRDVCWVETKIPNDSPDMLRSGKTSSLLGNPKGLCYDWDLRGTISWFPINLYELPIARDVVNVLLKHGRCVRMRHGLVNFESTTDGLPNCDMDAYVVLNLTIQDALLLNRRYDPQQDVQKIFAVVDEILKRNTIGHQTIGHTTGHPPCQSVVAESWFVTTLPITEFPSDMFLYDRKNLGNLPLHPEWGTSANCFVKKSICSDIICKSTTVFDVVKVLLKHGLCVRYRRGKKMWEFTTDGTPRPGCDEWISGFVCIETHLYKILSLIEKDHYSMTNVQIHNILTQKIKID